MAPLVSSAPFPDGGNNPTQLSEAQSIRLNELIAEGDNPEALVNFMNEGNFNTFDIFSDRLNLLMQHNRINSLEFLLPRIMNIDSIDKATLLADSLGEHLPEVSNLLLRSPNFTIGDPFFFRASFWLHIPTLVFADNDPAINFWSLDELINLMEHRHNHPGLVEMLAPVSSVWKRCPSAERGLLMIDFLRHLNNLKLRPFDPNRILVYFRDNDNLNDAEMSVIVQRLCDYGAQLDVQIIEAFQERHPNHLMTIQTMQNIFEGEAIKQPDCD